MLINLFGTITVLGVLIWTLGPISGGHFNPAVTAVATVRREMSPIEGLGYEDWALADPAGKGVESVRPIRDEIRGLIENLISELVPSSRPDS